jgi:hypothetical protein
MAEHEKNAKKGDAADGANPLFRTDAVYSARELREPEVGVSQYLVVGYAPREIKDYMKKKRQGLEKQRPVGSAAPPAQDIIPWDPARPPMIVVTEILPQQPEGIQLWALIYPKNGLCTPIGISQDLVFYLHEFRDNTTDGHKRASNWNRNVALQSIKPGLGAPRTSKQLAFKHAKDSVKLVFNPNVSLANEVASLIAGYVHSPSDWFLDEIVSVLKVIDDDLNHRPLPENSGLRMFVEVTGELSAEQATRVVEDFKINWPDVPHVTDKSIMELKRGLGLAEVDLEYKLIRPFIAEGCWRMSVNNFKQPKRLREMVVSTLETVTRVMGTSEWTPSISPADQNALLTTTLAKLREIKANAGAMEESMKATYGESAFDVSTYDIWEKFADAADTDTARAAWMQQLKLLAGGVRQKEATVATMVDDVIGTLAKLKLDG